MFGSVLSLTLITQELGIQWFRQNHLYFEIGILFGLLASIGYSIRLRYRRDLAPRGVFYLNLFGAGSYLIILVIGLAVTLFD